MTPQQLQVVQDLEWTLNWLAWADPGMEQSADHFRAEMEAKRLLSSYCPKCYTYYTVNGRAEKGCDCADL